MAITNIFVHLSTNKFVEMKRKPTESELDILQVLWEQGPCTVRSVNEIVNEKKVTGYTTTLKLMQIMLEKELLSRDSSSRTHIYTAAVSKASGQNQAVNNLIDSMFKGSSANLVMHALGNRPTSDKEIEQIKKYLDELKKTAN